jgi:hypothetical protein
VVVAEALLVVQQALEDLVVAVQEHFLEQEPLAQPILVAAAGVVPPLGELVE